MSEFTGGCLCGKLRYRLRGEALFVCVCHCRSCRLAAGAPYVGWLTYDTAAFEVTAGTLTERRSSERAVRGFCAECGTAVTYRPTERPEHVDVTLATLDDQDAAPPMFHVWVSEKPSWVTIGDDLPRFERMPGE